MKAKTTGIFTLTIPKTGNAPMLFLEWLSCRGKGMLYNVRDRKEDNIFSIRLSTENVNEDCVNYINLNLY